MNWISVNDQLPTITERYIETMNANIMASEPVLASLRGEHVIYGYFEKTAADIVFVEAPIVYDPFGEYVHGLSVVTHWMSLPTLTRIDT